MSRNVSRKASIYVHFPWCLAKCPYCDFVSYTPRAGGKTDLETATALIDHEGYADAIGRELAARRGALGEATIGSIFFGGGTPSLWDPFQLGRVIRAIRAEFSCANDLEITVECNPTSLDEARAGRLLDAGVGRLSIGVQSLRAEQLQFLGRLHDMSGAVDAVKGALRAGVPRVSADLIFGLPGQPPEDARAQALGLADLGLTHLSCYQLTIEPGTRFGELARRGRLPLADDGLVAEGFLAIDEALTSRGFGHYEISNYAKPGQEARHNLAYWHGDVYLGLGCGAYGFVWTPEAEGGKRGVRYRNVIDPRAYVEATRGMRAGLPALDDGLAIEAEALDGETLLRERIMLGLRLAEGVALEAAADELGVDPWPEGRRRAADRLVQDGRLARRGERWLIPPKAWVWADDTAARLF